MQPRYQLKTAISAGSTPKLPANCSCVQQLQQEQLLAYQALVASNATIAFMLTNLHRETWVRRNQTISPYTNLVWQMRSLNNEDDKREKVT